MKQKHFLLGASIVAALSAASCMAQVAVAGAPALVTAGTNEAPRVIQAVNDKVVSTLANTRLGAGKRFAPSSRMSVTPLPDSTPMNHLQLVLSPSAARQAALTGLIADQHNPKSARFHQWLTPEQFGANYGVVDSDIAAVTSWLTSQGFTVNSVYPNRTEIDFSGTVGQIRSAFRTQENLYAFPASQRLPSHIINDSDISVPIALKDVVAGVMGLNDYHARAMHAQTKQGQWDPDKKSFTIVRPQSAVKAAESTSAMNAGLQEAVGGKGSAVPFSNGARGLVPNDLATMYGVRTLRNNGVTGAGVTIAVVDDNNMVPADWTNFVSTFNLAQYNGTFNLVHPAPASGTNNCLDPDTVNTKGTEYYDPDDGETLLDAEWSTAMAPGAHIVVATCADSSDAAGNNPETSNFFGGVFIAATNLINASTGRPDIISASYGYGEQFTDAASKTAIDQMWAQADAEGISVFVSSGDSGSNPSFNNGIINSEGYTGVTGVDANSLGTSPSVTVVGGTDTADVLDGTTSKYFAPTISAVGGSALSYVPEIPWNQSCGNGVAARSLDYNRVIGFCMAVVRDDIVQPDYQSEASSGGPSAVDAKPMWQSQVFGAAADQSRDVPDVALFGGSYGGDTYVIVCDSAYPCPPNFTGRYTLDLSSGTSLSTPMFAGIQALMDQGLAARGLKLDQGNAAPTLYALAANEYGTAGNPNSVQLSACNSDNGATGSSNCVFHNITRGSISSNCFDGPFFTANCYYYASFFGPTGFGNSGNEAGTYHMGLTTTDANPTHYGVDNKAFGAQPGWSFASGLGSVNATNLLIALRAYDGAAPAPSSGK